MGFFPRHVQIACLKVKRLFRPHFKIPGLRKTLRRDESLNIKELPCMRCVLSTSMSRGLVYVRRKKNDRHSALCVVVGLGSVVLSNSGGVVFERAAALHEKLPAVWNAGVFFLSATWFHCALRVEITSPRGPVSLRIYFQVEKSTQMRRPLCPQVAKEYCNVSGQTFCTKNQGGKAFSWSQARG